MTNDETLAPSTSNPSATGSAEEQTRLDNAMRRADELLFASLKTEERHRNRRQIIFFSIGALVMLAIVCAILLGMTADTEKSSQLAQAGWQLWQARQFTLAVDKFQEAVKLDSKNSMAWNGLGWSQFNSGSYDPAIESFQHALRLEPNLPAAQNGIGQILLAEGKLDEAKLQLEKAAPEASAAWYGLARICLLQGKFDEAATWAKKVVDSGEADDTAKQMLQAAQDKKLPPELRREIQPAPIEKPSAAAKDLPKAWQLMNQGRRDEAKAIFEAALANAPNDSAVLNGLGWFYLTGGGMEQAQPYFEKALKADPKASGAMNGLARVLKAQGHTDEAIKLWQQMVDNFPGPNAGTAGLADVYVEKGEYKKAVPLLEQLVKANPQDPQFKNKLAQAREESAK